VQSDGTAGRDSPAADNSATRKSRSYRTLWPTRINPARRASTSRANSSKVGAASTSWLGDTVDVGGSDIALPVDQGHVLVGPRPVCGHLRMTATSMIRSPPSGEKPEVSKSTMANSASGFVWRSPLPKERLGSMPPAWDESAGRMGLGEAPQRAAATGLPRARFTEEGGSGHDPMEAGLPTESADWPTPIDVQHQHRPGGFGDLQHSDRRSGTSFG
jgi:hypothetical protein